MARVLSPNLYHADHDFALQTPHPGKAFACSPECLKDFGWAWPHPGWGWATSETTHFFRPLRKQSFISLFFIDEVGEPKWEFLYCKTWFIVSHFPCTVLPPPKAFFSVALQRTRINIAVCAGFGSSVPREEGRERGHVPPGWTQSRLALGPPSLMVWTLSWNAFQMLAALCASSGRSSWVCFFKSKASH